MATIKTAQTVPKGIKIGERDIIKMEAARRIRQDNDVWGAKSNAHALTESQCAGKGSMRHVSHVLGGYRYYHDENHAHSGHIFYGNSA